MINYTEIFRQSPNTSGTLAPRGIVLHHSGGSYVGSVSWILNRASKVSYHCLVNTNGERTVMVQDIQRAWHAGASSFRGQSHCNTFMLGIAVTGDTNSRELTTDEINSVAQWCVNKMRQYNFGLDMITTHREVSPGRKNDVDVRAERAIKNRIAQLLNPTSASVSDPQPVVRTYTVKRGDTLSRIAANHNTTVVRIREANALSSDVIKIGQVLRLPWESL
jgi:AmpD protein